ncbi:hypothetical protein Vretimale_4682, partial [Volvox reticuliferus]
MTAGTISLVAAVVMLGVLPGCAGACGSGTGTPASSSTGTCSLSCSKNCAASRSKKASPTWPCFSTHTSSGGWTPVFSIVGSIGADVVGAPPGGRDVGARLRSCNNSPANSRAMPPFPTSSSRR